MFTRPQRKHAWLGDLAVHFIDGEPIGLSFMERLFRGPLGSHVPTRWSVSRQRAGCAISRVDQQQCVSIATELRGDDELARLAVGDMKRGGQSIDLAETGDIGPGLKRSGGDVESAVDNAAIGLGDPLGEVRFPLEKYKAFLDAAVDDAKVRPFYAEATRLVQFLLEALIMAFLGGLIGVGVGIGVAEILSKVSGILAVIELYSIVLSLSFSGGVMQ